MMDQHTEPRLESLDEEECRELIAGGGVGRIGYRSRYGLVVVPVNYVVHDGDVVFRTTVGGSMDEDLRTGIAGAEYLVAFEIDRINERTREGWSVLIQGTAHHAGADPGRATAADVRPWPGGHRDLYFRVVPTRITGRAVRADGPRREPPYSG